MKIKILDKNAYNSKHKEAMTKTVFTKEKHKKREKGYPCCTAFC